MKEHKFEFQYEIYNDSSELKKEDAELLGKARAVTKYAYAPYSDFRVGAAGMLVNGEIISGTNQENASFPVGICAERVLLGAAASMHPGIPIETIAVSYDSDNVSTDHPISPCGMCRQALIEQETRFHQPIRLILSGQQGKVLIIRSAVSLLPFAFTGDELE